MVAGVSSTVPSSATRPSAIIRSISRREATPARASSLAMRSPFGAPAADGSFIAAGYSHFRSIANFFATVAARARYASDA